MFGVWQRKQRPSSNCCTRLAGGIAKATIQRLQVKYPADDDNLWYSREGDRDLQFDCHPGGRPPALVEGGDNERIEAQNVREAMAAIDRLME